MGDAYSTTGVDEPSRSNKQTQGQGTGTIHWLPFSICRLQGVSSESGFRNDAAGCNGGASAIMQQGAE